ncbi:nucleotidyltransferase [Methanosarcinales archaeon ex4484_138]|nr:MAG: nucleotidyltransferase [Methanosarcinales archaeon ex4484_138]
MGSHREVRYSEDHWKLLEVLQTRATRTMERLEDNGIESLAFGSVARGDVTSNSDIDLFLTQRIPSFRIELGEIDVSFPLIEPTDSEIDFHFFAGAITTRELHRGERKTGVDKRLIRIRPTEEGHIEDPITDVSSGVLAREIGVSQRIVDERRRVLTRRSKVGITGIHLERRLASFESFEDVLCDLVNRDAALRRCVHQRGGL